MQYKLSQLVNYSNDKINSSLLTKLNYISTENMLPNIGGIIKSSNVPLNTNVCKFTKDNILLSNIRPYFHKLYLSTFTGGCSNDVLCFKITNPKIINPKYLYYAMSTKSFINYVVSTSKGTKMPRGDKNAILEYTLNVTSIPQQLLIVDIIAYLKFLLLSLLILDFLLINLFLNIHLYLLNYILLLLFLYILLTLNF